MAVFEGQDNSIPPIAMGSHLDSVATGGKFDGPLGVCVPFIARAQYRVTSWASSFFFPFRRIATNILVA